MMEPIRLEIVFRPGMDPLDRQWFEEQLEEAFAEEGLGEVIGGGTALDGTRSDIAVDVNDPERGLSVVLDVLRREQAPPDTQLIEYGKELVIHPVYDERHPYLEPEEPHAGATPGAEQTRGADLPQLGDAYLVPLGGNLFGACRVIAIQPGQYATLVAGTDWFGEAAPPLTEPRLRSLLVHTCVGARAPSCKFWLAGKPPEEFRYLGVLEPSAEEQRMGYGQHTENWMMVARSLLMQWEWLQEGEE